MLSVPRSFSVAILLFSAFCFRSSAQPVELKNATTLAQLGPRGLVSVTDSGSKSRVDLSADEWSMRLGDRALRSQDANPTIRKAAADEVIYEYDLPPYRIEAFYSIKPGWNFISKQLRVKSIPGQSFTVSEVVPWDLRLKTQVQSEFIPTVYVPHFGATLEESRKSLPGKDYGAFLRFENSHGAFLTVQNPFLQVHREDESIIISYAPDMEWQSSWGEFTSDIASIGTYRLTGIRNAREMVKEWHSAPSESATDGMDKAEVEAFSSCVRAFLVVPAPDPIS